jgi:hypothetical protein
MRAKPQQRPPPQALTAGSFGSVDSPCGTHLVRDLQRVAEPLRGEQQRAVALGGGGVRTLKGRFLTRSQG